MKQCALAGIALVSSCGRVSDRVSKGLVDKKYSTVELLIKLNLLTRTDMNDAGVPEGYYGEFCTESSEGI